MFINYKTKANLKLPNITKRLKFLYKKNNNSI